MVTRDVPAEAVSPATLTVANSADGDFRCRICGSSAAVSTHTVREMMLGTRDRFTYAECAGCGCVQLTAPPADLSRYYPANYYSFAPPRRRAAPVRWVRALRNRGAFAPHPGLWRWLSRLKPYGLEILRRWMRDAGVTEDARILDVGCGSGRLLRDLHSAGFRRLTGADPHLDHEISSGEELRIVRKTIHELTGPFDLIVFNHSLEHIVDQQATLRSVARLLAGSGQCVIRTPVASSFAWEEYREDWVQLDAPRHVVVHSERSLRRLGEEAGLHLGEAEYDSTDFQFAGSELYRRDLSLSHLDGAFSRRELRAFRRRAAELNRLGRGDQAAFRFVKA